MCAYPMMLLPFAVFRHAIASDPVSGSWPLLVAGVVVLLMLLKGDLRTAIPLAGGAVLLQAWQAGLFG